MEKGYRFLSESEPSDEQLSSIMKEVAVEAKRKADKSNKLFWKQLPKMIKVTQNQELAKTLNT
jgi:signal recognition particle subunit SEC65